MVPQTTSSPRVRWSTVALPPEHGAWGFLLEPLVLGLGVALSVGGLLLALGVIGAFLVRQPLKIAWIDHRQGRRYARSRAARQFALFYGLLALAGIAGGVALAEIAVLLPLLPGLPLALVMFASYAQNRGRDLLPEVAGACAMALSAACLAIAGDRSWEVALALWGILLARNIPSILYIRARLRLEKGKPHTPAIVWAANGVALIGVGTLAAAGAAPWLAALALAVLAVRAIYGLSPYRRQVAIKTLGFLEIGYGLLVVLLTALGYRVGW